MDADHPYLLATSEATRRDPIVELPGHWCLDDWEPYNYLPGITGSGVIASPADVLARWTLELEALVEEGGLFMLTNHPFVSRPGVAGGRAGDADRAGQGDRRPVDRDGRGDRRARGDAGARAGRPSGRIQAEPAYTADEPRRLTCRRGSRLSGGGHRLRRGCSAAARPEPVDGERHEATDDVGEVGVVEVVGRDRS